MTEVGDAMLEPPAIRAAHEGDLDAIETILRAYDEPYDGAPPVADGAWTPYFRHLLERGTILVAESADGTVAGFGAVVETGRALHLSDLFVRPQLLGLGVGGRLLRELFGDGPGGGGRGDRRPRTTFASGDPRAMALYIRAGMTPCWPNLYLIGDARRLGGSSPAPDADATSPAADAHGRISATHPDADAHGRISATHPDADAHGRITAAGAGAGAGASGFAARAIDPLEAARIETGWTGLDRIEDYRRWADFQAARAWLVTDPRGRPTAVGLHRRRLRGDGRWVIRAVVAPHADPVGPMLAGLAASGDEAGRTGACLPGPSPILRPLLDAGFRIVDRDTFMASRPDLVDPDHTIVDTGIP